MTTERTNATNLLFLGHSTVLIESPNGKRILIDPFLEQNPQTPPSYRAAASLGTINFLLISHLHADHVNDAPSVVRANPDVTVICVPEVQTWLNGKIRANFAPMNKGGTQILDGIHFTMTHADHTAGLEENGVRIYGGEPVGFVLKMETGFTIYHAGDTALFGDMALIKRLYKPELALLPIGDCYTMGPKAASIATEMLGVKNIVPLHYGTYPALTGTPQEFALAVRETLTETSEVVNIHVLKPGESKKFRSENQP